MRQFDLNQQVDAYLAWYTEIAERFRGAKEGRRETGDGSRCPFGRLIETAQNASVTPIRNV